LFRQRQGANRRQLTVVSSAARGNPPANNSPLVSENGQSAGNWQSLISGKWHPPENGSVVSSAARGNPPTNDTTSWLFFSFPKHVETKLRCDALHKLNSADYILLSFLSWLSAKRSQYVGYL
jgi:hypothetical protein